MHSHPAKRRALLSSDMRKRESAVYDRNATVLSRVVGLIREHGLNDCLAIGPERMLDMQACDPTLAVSNLMVLCQHVLHHHSDVPAGKKLQLSLVAKHLYPFMSGHQKEMAVSRSIVPEEEAGHFSTCIREAKIETLSYRFMTEEYITEMSCMSKLPRVVSGTHTFSTMGVQVPISSQGMAISKFMPPDMSLVLSPEQVESVKSGWYPSPSYSGPNTVTDARMGSCDEAELCETCELTRSSGCMGHMGHIVMPFPLFNPHTLSYVLRILKCTCTWCNKLMIQTFWTSHSQIVESLRLIHSRVEGEDRSSRIADERKRLDGLMKLVDRNTSRIKQIHREFGSDLRRLRGEIFKFITPDKGSRSDIHCPHCGTPQFSWSISKMGTHIDMSMSASARGKLEYIAGHNMGVYEESDAPDDSMSRADGEGASGHGARGATSRAGKVTAWEAENIHYTNIDSTRMMGAFMKVKEAAESVRKMSSKSYAESLRTGHFNIVGDDKSPAMSAEIAYKCLRGLDRVSMSIMGFEPDEEEIEEYESVRGLFGEVRARESSAMSSYSSAKDREVSGAGAGAVAVAVAGVGSGDKSRAEARNGERFVVEMCEKIEGLIKNVSQAVGSTSGAEGHLAIMRLIKEGEDLARANSPRRHFHMGMLMYSVVPVMPNPHRAPTVHGHPMVTKLYNQLALVKSIHSGVSAAMDRANMHSVGGDERRRLVDFMSKLWEHAQNSLCMIMSPSRFSSRFEEMKDEQGVVDKLKGKETGPRSSIMGTRVNNSATMVASLANNLPFGWSTFPKVFAQKQFLIETVTSHNIERVREKIAHQKSGIRDWWTIRSVLVRRVHEDGEVTFTPYDYKDAIPSVGDRVERSMVHGDCVFVTRAPVLKGGGLDVHRVLITETAKRYDIAPESIVAKYSDAVAMPKNLDYDGDSTGTILIPQEEERIESAIMAPGDTTIEPAKSMGATCITIADGSLGMFNLSNRQILSRDVFGSLMDTGRAAYLRGEMRRIGMYVSGDDAPSEKERDLCNCVEALVCESIRIAASRLPVYCQGGGGGGEDAGAEGGTLTTRSNSELLMEVLRSWDHEEVLRHMLFASRKGLYNTLVSEIGDKGMLPGHVLKHINLACLRQIALTQVVQRFERERLCAKPMSVEQVLEVNASLGKALSELDSHERWEMVPLELLSSICSWVRQLAYSSPSHVHVLYRPHPGTLLTEGPGGELGPHVLERIKEHVDGGGCTDEFGMACLLSDIADARHRGFFSSLKLQRMNRAAREVEYEAERAGKGPFVENEPPVPAPPLIVNDLSKCEWDAYSMKLSRLVCGDDHSSIPSGRSCVFYMIERFNPASRAQEAPATDRDMHHLSLDSSGQRDRVVEPSTNPLIDIVSNTYSITDIMSNGEVRDLRTIVSRMGPSRSGFADDSVDPDALVWLKDPDAQYGLLSEREVEEAMLVGEQRGMRRISQANGESQGGWGHRAGGEAAYDAASRETIEQEIEAAIHEAKVNKAVETNKTIRLQMRERYAKNTDSSSRRSFDAGLLSASCPFLERFVYFDADESRVLSCSKWKFGKDVASDPFYMSRVKSNPFVIDVMNSLSEENCARVREWKEKADVCKKFFQKVCTWLVSLGGDCISQAMHNASLDEQRQFVMFCDRSVEVTPGMMKECRALMRKFGPSILEYHRRQAHLRFAEMEHTMRSVDFETIRALVPSSTEHELRHYSKFVSERSHSSIYQELYTGSDVISNLMPQLDYEEASQRSVASDLTAVRLLDGGDIEKLRLRSEPYAEKMIDYFKKKKELPLWHSGVVTGPGFDEKFEELMSAVLDYEEFNDTLSEFTEGRKRCMQRLARCDKKRIYLFDDPVECLEDYFSRGQARDQFEKYLRSGEKGDFTRLPGSHIEIATLSDYGDLFGEEECRKDEDELTRLMTADQRYEWKTGRLIRKRMMGGANKEYLIIRRGVVLSGVIDDSLMGPSPKGFLFRTSIEFGQRRAASLISTLGKVGYRWADLSPSSVSLADFIVPPESLRGEALEFAIHPGPPHLEKARELAFAMALNEKNRIMRWFDVVCPLSRSKDARDVERFRGLMNACGARGYSDNLEDPATFVDKLLLQMMTTLRTYWAEIFVVLTAGERSHRDCSVAVMMMGDRTGGSGAKGNKTTLAKIMFMFGHFMIDGVGMRPSADNERLSTYMPFADHSAEGNGAVVYNFITGLTTPVMRMYGTAALDGCMKKVIVVAGVGDTSRGSSCATIDQVIWSDGSLRGADGRIIEQVAGGTGDDPSLVVQVESFHYPEERGEGCSGEETDWQLFVSRMKIPSASLELAQRLREEQLRADEELVEEKLRGSAYILDRCRSWLSLHAPGEEGKASSDPHLDFLKTDLSRVKTQEQLAALKTLMPWDEVFASSHNSWWECMQSEVDTMLERVDSAIVHADAQGGGGANAKNAKGGKSQKRSVSTKDKVLGSIVSKLGKRSGVAKSELVDMEGSVVGESVLKSAVLKAARGMGNVYKKAGSGRQVPEGREKMGSGGEGGGGGGEEEGTEEEEEDGESEERGGDSSTDSVALEVADHPFALLRRGLNHLPEYRDAVSNLPGPGKGMVHMCSQDAAREKEGMDGCEEGPSASEGERDGRPTSEDEGVGLDEATSIAGSGMATERTGSTDTRRSEAIDLLTAYSKMYLLDQVTERDRSTVDIEGFVRFAIAHHFDCRTSRPSREMFDEFVCKMRQNAHSALCELGTYASEDNRGEAMRLARVLGRADREVVLKIVTRKLEKQARKEVEERMRFEEEFMQTSEQDWCVSTLEDRGAPGTGSDVKDRALAAEALAAERGWIYLQKWGFHTGMRKTKKVYMPVDVKSVLKKYCRKAGRGDVPASVEDVMCLRMSIMEKILFEGIKMREDFASDQGVPNSLMGDGETLEFRTRDPYCKSRREAVLRGASGGVLWRKEAVYSREEVQRRRKCLGHLITHPYHNPLFLAHLCVLLNGIQLAGVSLDGLKRACECIVHRFLEVKLKAGTPMGIRLAYCMSEPVMQSMLDAFKSAGDGLDTEGRELRMRAALKVSSNPDCRQLTLDLSPMVRRMNEALVLAGRVPVKTTVNIKDDIEKSLLAKKIMEALMKHHISILCKVSMNDIIISMKQYACNEKYRSVREERLDAADNTVTMVRADTKRATPAFDRFGYGESCSQRRYSNTLDLDGFDYMHCGTWSSCEEDEEWVVRQMVCMGYLKHIPVPGDLSGLPPSEKKSFMDAWRLLYSKNSHNVLSVLSHYICTDSVLRIEVSRREMESKHISLYNVVKAIYRSRGGAPTAPKSVQVLTNFDPSRTCSEQPVFVIRIRKTFSVSKSDVATKNLDEKDREFLRSKYDDLRHIVSIPFVERGRYLRTKGSLAFSGFETEVGHDHIPRQAEIEKLLSDEALLASRQAGTNGGTGVDIEVEAEAEAEGQRGGGSGSGSGGGGGGSGTAPARVGPEEHPEDRDDSVAEFAETGDIEPEHVGIALSDRASKLREILEREDRILSVDYEFATGVPFPEHKRMQIIKLAQEQFIRSKIIKESALSRKNPSRANRAPAHSEYLDVAERVELMDLIRERMMSMHKDAASSCIALTSSNQTNDVLRSIGHAHLKGCVDFGKWRVFVEESSEPRAPPDCEKRYRSPDSVDYAQVFSLKQRISRGSIVGVDASPYVDINKSRTHTSYDCNRRFGIMSMVSSGERELRELLESGGHHVSTAAIRMVMCFVSWPGFPAPLNGYGISGHGGNCLERASFSHGPGVLNEAAYSSRKDVLRGFNNLVYCGGDSGCGVQSSRYIRKYSVPTSGDSASVGHELGHPHAY